MESSDIFEQNLINTLISQNEQEDRFTATDYNFISLESQEEEDSILPLQESNSPIILSEVERRQNRLSVDELRRRERI